jgi:hypothetical protein
MNLDMKKEEIVTLLNSIMEILVEMSRPISNLIVFYNSETVHESGPWVHSEILQILEDWDKGQLKGILLYGGKKFIRIHLTEFNLFFKSVKEKQNFSGGKLSIEGSNITFFVINGLNVPQPIVIAEIRNVLQRLFWFISNIFDPIVIKNDVLVLDIAEQVKNMHDKVVDRSFINRLKQDKNKIHARFSTPYNDLYIFASVKENSAISELLKGIQPIMDENFNIKEKDLAATKKFLEDSGYK